MPKREDIQSVLVIGSGPIIIGQACEFDYSGTQGAKALRDEGIKVILVNSNPATISTESSSSALAPSSSGRPASSTTPAPRPPRPSRPTATK